MFAKTLVLIGVLGAAGTHFFVPGRAEAAASPVSLSQSCQVEHLGLSDLTLRCQPGTPAPADPRNVAGVPSQLWTLGQTRHTPKAAVYTYTAIGRKGEARFY